MACKHASTNLLPDDCDDLEMKMFTMYCYNKYTLCGCAFCSCMYMIVCLCACVHECVPVCVMRVCTYVRTYMIVCLCACVHECVPVCVCA